MFLENDWLWFQLFRHWNFQLLTCWICEFNNVNDCQCFEGVTDHVSNCLNTEVFTTTTTTITTSSLTPKLNKHHPAITKKQAPSCLFERTHKSDNLDIKSTLYILERAAFPFTYCQCSYHFHRLLYNNINKANPIAPCTYVLTSPATQNNTLTEASMISMMSAFTEVLNSGKSFIE